jgi:mRNA interferase MazF
LKRGDIVRVAARGPYSGKPWPALVVQSDLFTPTHASVTLCLITSELRDAPLFRPTIAPAERTGLTKPSQIMVDKIFSAPRESLGEEIGAVDEATMRRVEEALRLWLEL